MNNTPLVSFIIPAYNEEILLPSCLLSLQRMCQDHNVNNFEIIVCDNNSTDETAQVAQAAGARVVFEPHNQIAKARNTAAQQTTGQWLCFVDADTLIPPKLGRKFFELIQKPETGGGGTLVDFDVTNTPFFAKLVLQLWNKVSVIFSLAAGSFIFCRKQAWTDVGGFDEAYYAAEEVYFSQALKKWCKTKKLNFKIIQDASVSTSARKLEWNSSISLFTTMLKLLRPGALKNRSTCSFWYQRPKLKT